MNISSMSMLRSELKLRPWIGPIVLGLMLFGYIGEGDAQVKSTGKLLPRAEFFPEPKIDPDIDFEIPPPSFEGKVMIRGRYGRWKDVEPRSKGTLKRQLLPLGDIFVADGAENALAINIGNSDNLVAVNNRAFSTSPSMSTSDDGNVTWTVRTFPDGGGTYTDQPYDPWANAGNAADVLFATLIRRDTATDNSHCVIARSTDAGVTWPLFFERLKDTFQDREMVNIDRTTALGGGPGTTHDGKVYLCYDDFGVNAAGYVGSYLQVISPTGTALTELTISTSAVFKGSKLQPVSGTTDGQVYLMGLSSSGGGANRILSFHEVTGAGSGTNLDKSFIAFPTTGQQLGASTRYGVNGHRINSHMYMDIDLTNGPQRGYLYVISNRNPNPGDPTLDQGDVYLSVSPDGASNWASVMIPGQAAGKTQFFSMIDVDESGILHVAYYQNETGSVNNGVLNAGSANLYYTRSEDGGFIWETHVQLNEPANTLDYFEPPPDLSAQNYYLIGDYCQIKAADGGDRAYVFWTGYDKDRGNNSINDKRERVICTTLSTSNGSNVVPTLSEWGVILMVVTMMICIGVYSLRR